VANRPTPNDGKGGSDGSARSPYARVVPARRLRARLSPVNDNREPPMRRAIRLTVLGSAVALPVVALAVYFLS
jgi:hypothetical protein